MLKLPSASVNPLNHSKKSVLISKFSAIVDPSLSFSLRAIFKDLAPSLVSAATGARVPSVAELEM